MQKLSFTQVTSMCYDHNRSHNINARGEDPNPLSFVAVFKDGSKYRFTSENKRFFPNAIGTSTAAHNVDDNEDIINLTRVDFDLVDHIYQEV